MKNGTEVRKNGSKITKRSSGNSVSYYVEKVDENDKLVPSLNGPWDYLGNARSDADGWYDETRCETRNASTTQRRPCES